MELTIAEQIVRTRERRRRYLEALKQGKSLRQMVSEEGHARMAHILARKLAPYLVGQLSRTLQDSLYRFLETTPTGESLQEPQTPWRPEEGAHEEPFAASTPPAGGLESASLDKLTSRIGDLYSQLETILGELASIRRSWQHEPPEPSEESKVPISDIAGMVDKLSSYYR